MSAQLFWDLEEPWMWMHSKLWLSADVHWLRGRWWAEAVIGRVPPQGRMPASDITIERRFRRRDHAIRWAKRAVRMAERALETKGAA